MENEAKVVEVAEVKEVKEVPAQTEVKEEPKKNFGDTAKKIGGKVLKFGAAALLVGVGYVAGENSGLNKTLREFIKKQSSEPASDPGSDTTDTPTSDTTETFEF